MPIDARQMQSCSSSVSHSTDEPQSKSESGKADKIFEQYWTVSIVFDGGIVGWKTARGVNDQNVKPCETTLFMVYRCLQYIYIILQKLYYKNSWTFYAYDLRQTLPSSKWFVRCIFDVRHATQALGSQRTSANDNTRPVSPDPRIAGWHSSIVC